MSGFDAVLGSIQRPDFLYAGYSAGVCVLGPDLRGLQIVDDPTIMPYPEIKEVIWDGLKILDYLILPHHDSDHPESEAIGKEVRLCEQERIPFMTLRDGDVII